MSRMEYQKEYYRIHKEQKLAKRKEYRNTHKEQIVAYRDAHKEQAKSYQVEYRESHKIQKSIKAKIYRQTHAEQEKARSREYYKTHKEQASINTKEYRMSHKDKMKSYDNEYMRNRRKEPKHHLNSTVSIGIRECIRKGIKAHRRWELLVGYTVTQLKKHLEKQFKPGMTWGNYGTYWHIDHKIPIAAFNFTCPEDIDFKRCWALSNLRPLWKYENISKGAKVDRPFQPSLAIQISKEAAAIAV